MDHGPWNSSKVSVKSRLVRLSQISRKVSESDKNQRSKMWKGFVDIPNEPVCQRWCIFSFKLRWCNKCLYCINNPRYLVEGNKVNLFYRWQRPWAVWSESYVLIGCPSEQNGPFLTTVIPRKKIASLKNKVFYFFFFYFSVFVSVRDLLQWESDRYLWLK